jgi:putative tryptophan/tyrosine transport system substrate-binding protein
MDRRAFVGAVALGLLAAPLAAEAQPAGKVWRVGWLAFGPTVGPDLAPEFVRQLEELGYVRGQNLVIEIRGHHDQARLPALASELIQLGVDVIVANGTVAAQAAKSVAPTAPIVFLVSADPIGAGLVASLARPGGNVTGPSASSPEFAAKRLELFKAAVPRLNHIGVLGNPTGISARMAREIEAAAPVAGVQVRRFMARGEEDLEAVFAMIRKERLDGLLIVNSPEFIAARARLTELALRARLPTMFEEWRFVETGGLMAYGPSYPEVFRRAAVYVDKILKGAKPANLPVEQPTKYELVINLKTAKALGLTIPQSLLLRADQVIE